MTAECSVVVIQRAAVGSSEKQRTESAGAVVDNSHLQVKIVVFAYAVAHSCREGCGIKHHRSVAKHPRVDDYPRCQTAAYMKQRRCNPQAVVDLVGRRHLKRCRGSVVVAEWNQTAWIAAPESVAVGAAD